MFLTSRRESFGEHFGWCSDRFGVYKVEPAVDPLNLNGDRGVLRGGAFSYDSAYVRSAYRHKYLQRLRSDNHEFLSHFEKGFKFTVLVQGFPPAAAKSGKCTPHGLCAAVCRDLTT